MNTQININWAQAQSISQEVTKEQTQAQAEAIKEFLESNHEMTDAKDLQYYADKTGKELNWLIENGQGINQTLKTCLLMGASIEETINIDFQKQEQNAQEDKICFYVQNYDPYNKKMHNEPIYNYEVEEHCGSYWEQLSKEDKNIIIEEFNN